MIIEEDDANFWIYHIDGGAINQLTFYKQGWSYGFEMRRLIARHCWQSDLMQLMCPTITVRNDFLDNRTFIGNVRKKDYPSGIKNCLTTFFGEGIIFFI